MISKGNGIPRAVLREQRLRDLISNGPTFKNLSLIKDVKIERVEKVYDLTIYTKKGKLRKNLAPLDRTYKSKTHVRVQSTGEILTRVEWKSREKKRIYQLRIDSMQCVRCGKSREREEVITCKSCTKQSRILYNKKASV